MSTIIHERREERLATQLAQTIRELSAYHKLDESLSLRIKITDQLWRFRPTDAQALLRQLWREIEHAAAQATLRFSESWLREQAVQVALQREGEEAEGWLRDLDEEARTQLARERARRGESRASRLPYDTPEGRHRFFLARNLIRVGAVATATRVVAPALEYITQGGLDFLTWLSNSLPDLADQYYQQWLQIALNDAKADANTVGVLMSYAYTPGTIPQFLHYGLGVSGGYGNEAYRLPSASVQQQFLAAAATILQRPHLINDSSDDAPGVEGTYRAVNYLLAFVGENDSSAVRALQQYQLYLEKRVSPQSHGAGASFVAQQREKNEKVYEPLDMKALLQTYRTAATTEAKDQAAAALGQALAHQGDASALEYIAIVADPYERAVTERFIEYALLLAWLKEGAYEAAISLLEKGHYDALDKALTLVHAAKAYHAHEPQKALAWLADAVIHCQSVTPHEQLIGVTVIGETYLAFGEEAQVWTMAEKIARAADKVVFDTDDAQQATNFSITIEQEVAWREFYRFLACNDFRDYVLPTREGAWQPESLFTSLFADLAERDLLRTLELVQTIRKEVRWMKTLEAIFERMMGRDVGM